MARWHLGLQPLVLSKALPKSTCRTGIFWPLINETQGTWWAAPRLLPNLPPTHLSPRNSPVHTLTPLTLLSRGSTVAILSSDVVSGLPTSRKEVYANEARGEWLGGAEGSTSQQSGNLT